MDIAVRARKQPQEKIKINVIKVQSKYHDSVTTYLYHPNQTSVMPDILELQ